MVTPGTSYCAELATSVSVCSSLGGSEDCASVTAYSSFYFSCKWRWVYFESVACVVLEWLISRPAVCNEYMHFSGQVVGASCSSGVPSERSIHSSGMYKLDIELKRGNNLAIRDRGGRVVSSRSLSLSALFLFCSSFYGSVMVMFLFVRQQWSLCQVQARW